MTDLDRMRTSLTESASRQRRSRWSTALLLGALATGCKQAAGDLKEWTPADHTNTKSTAASPARQSTGEADPARQAGLDDVTLASWRQNCILCHGPLGRGDGQQGPLLGAKDLTAPAFQASVLDEQMALVIRQGRNKMPAFGHLPETTIGNLVKLIRLLGAYVASTAAAASTAGNAVAHPAAGTAAEANKAHPAVGSAAPSTTPAGTSSPSGRPQAEAHEPLAHPAP